MSLNLIKMNYLNKNDIYFRTIKLTNYIKAMSLNDFIFALLLTIKINRMNLV
ncbi:hypothetical protein MTsDn5_33320 [Alteromonas gracilis]